jgi:hypothetical protein
MTIFVTMEENKKGYYLVLGVCGFRVDNTNSNIKRKLRFQKYNRRHYLQRKKKHFEEVVLKIVKPEKEPKKKILYRALFGKSIIYGDSKKSL